MVRPMSGPFVLDGHPLTYPALFAISPPMLTRLRPEPNAAFRFTPNPLTPPPHPQPAGVARASPHPAAHLQTPPPMPQCPGGIGTSRGHDHVAPSFPQPLNSPTDRHAGNAQPRSRHPPLAR